MIVVVASAVCWASCLTSSATTANPLPASPARAASMVAFKASRLVCEAIAWMRSTTPLISALAAARLSTTWPASSAVATATPAIDAASVMLREMSVMLAVISSLAVETVVASVLVSSELATSDVFAAISCSAVWETCRPAAWISPDEFAEPRHGLVHRVAQQVVLAARVDGEAEVAVGQAVRVPGRLAHVPAEGAERVGELADLVAGPVGHLPRDVADRHPIGDLGDLAQRPGDRHDHHRRR